MVDIVFGDFTVVDLNHMADNAHDVMFGDGAMRTRDEIIQIKLLIKLVATNQFKVVMTWVKELFSKVAFCGFHDGRFARA